jgi:hypothetical protein
MNLFDEHHGRSFVRRKLTDLAPTVVLRALVLATVVLMFGGVGVVRDPVRSWCRHGVADRPGGRQLSSARCSSSRFSIS